MSEPLSRTDSWGEHWARISSLFAAALERPAGQRPAFLEERCGQDAELRREVESLLAAEAASEGLLPRIGGVVELQPNARLTPGSRLGPFEIVSFLGYGGMGEVYEARRLTPELEQRVALKVIKQGLKVHQVLERFHREGQILASLEHPNIARLIDGGHTPQGLPYLAMELVQGEAIDRYCDRHRLTIAERLELFLVACDAVSYAHQKLVIHRDIKPSNVFVSAEGRVKLLDFGTAKLLGANGARESLATTLGGALCFTPSYASPEQARSGEVTTATDVYGLGALLHELLVGKPPRGGAGSDPEEVLVALREGREPEPLARTLSSGSVTPDPVALAACRKTGVRRLHRQLRGDLDKIVRKALRGDPAARYGSVHELALDIRRYLRGEPVSARRPSVVYTTTRFVSRHWQGITVLLLFVSLMIGTLLRVTLESRARARERDRAEVERLKAENVSAFLIDLFADIDPEGIRAPELALRQVLDQGVSKLDRELVDQPEVRADLLEALGVIYRKIGEYDRAEILLGECLDLRERQYGPLDLTVAGTLEEQAQLEIDRDNGQGALERARAALRIRERVQGIDHPALTTALSQESEAWGLLGHYPESLAAARRATALARVDPQAINPAHLAEALGALGKAETQVGLLLESRSHYQEALDLLVQLHGRQHVLPALMLQSISVVDKRLGNFERAEKTLRESLEISTQVLGEDHPYAIAARFTLAGCLTELGDFAQSEALYQKDYEFALQQFGRGTVRVGVVLHGLGYLYYRWGRLQQAERYLQQALSELQASLGEGHPHTAITLHYLAAVALERGDLPAADRLSQQALTIRREQLHSRHPRIAESLHQRGQLAWASENLEDAERLFQQALDIRRESLPEGHPFLVESLFALAQLRAAKDRAAALKLAHEALDIRRQFRSVRPPTAVEIEGWIAAHPPPP